MRRNHPGVLQQVYSHKMEQQWWPWTVTATAGRHHCNINMLSILVPPIGGARRITNVTVGLVINVVILMCLLSTSHVSAADVKAEQTAQNSEKSGWELSIANGLMLFKREKSSQPRQQPEQSQIQQKHLPDIQKSLEYEVDGDVSNEEYPIEIESWFMPAVSTHFSSEISGIVARSTIVQTFKNPTNEWLNGTYQFPLPEDSAVDFLQMRIGQREILGEIQRKQEARKQFRKAQQRGQKASLVEQQRANLFTTSLANIGPGEEIEIEIQFQQQARFVNGEFRLRFPTTFTPRAILPNTLQSSNSQETLQSQTGPILPGNEPNFTAQIRVNAGSELTYLRSPDYVMLSEHTDSFDYQMVTATPQYGFQDMEILWRYQDVSPQLLHYREATSDGEYGLLMVLPGDPLFGEKSSGREVLSGDRHDPSYPTVHREITFVIDTSSSMAGGSIVQAKAALKLAVESLNPSDSFNILEFNSVANEMWSHPKPSHSGNTQYALRFLDKLQASGGTNISVALQLALDIQRNSEKLNQLVFITDGAIGYEDELLRDLETQLGDMRLFTVGIGSAPNSYFMVEAAKVGRGSFTYISDLSQVSKRMSELLEKIAKPSITDITADFGMDVEMYPESIPDLYDGEPIIVSYFAPQAVSQIDVDGVTGKGSSSEASWQKSLQLEYLGDKSGIAKHWAKFKIRELLRQKRIAPARNDVQKAKFIIEEITQTALTHNLVSSYTSLIAIEKEVTNDGLVTLDFASQQAKLKAQQLMVSMPNTAAGSNQAFYLAISAILLALVISLWSGLPRFTLLKVSPGIVNGEHHVSQ